MWQKIKEEPVFFQGLVQALLGLLIAFGLKLDPGKMAAILTFSAAGLTFLTRQAVTPTANPRAQDGTQLVPKALGAAAAD
jgi:hypothetical protein